MKKNVSKAITMALMFSISLTACGHKQQEAPELLEPVSSSISTREVVRHDIADYDVKKGTVMPYTYTAAFSRATILSDVAVSVGDYVEKGDVLANGRTEEYQKLIDSTNEELTAYKNGYSLEKQIAENELSQLTLTRQQALDNGDQVMADTLNIQISQAQENINYNQNVYDAKVSGYQNDIADYTENLKKETLYSEFSGTVIYTADSYLAEVPASCPVVVVARDDDKYLLADSIFNISDMTYGFFCICDGENVNINYRTVSEDFENVIQYSGGEMLNTSFDFVDDNSFEVGDNTLIFGVENLAEDVLAVSNDSIYYEGDMSYVYVLNGRTKEKVYVKTGIKTDLETEITSGLNEGDKVCYDSSDVLLTDYSEYVVEVSDWEDEITLNNGKVINLNQVTVAGNSSVQGNIEAVMVKGGTHVEEGDVLVRIRYADNSADITALNTSRTRLTDSYNSSKTQLEQLISNLNQALVAKKQDSSATSIEIDLAQLQYDNAVLQLSKLSLQYNASYEALTKQINELHNNSGEKTITAPVSGVLQSSSYNWDVYDYDSNTGDTTTALSTNFPAYGRYSTIVPDEEEDSLILAPVMSSVIPCGKQAQVCIDGYDERLEGTVVYGNVFPGSYIELSEEGGQLLYINVALPNDVCYISLTEESKLKLSELNSTGEKLTLRVEVNAEEYKNVIVLDKKCLQKDEENRYYVWKINDDESLTKQFVTVGTYKGDRGIVIAGLSVGDKIARLE